MRYEDIDVALSFLPFCQEGRGIVLLVDHASDLPLVRRHIFKRLGTPGTNLSGGMSYNRKWIYLRFANNNLMGIKDWIYPVARASDQEPTFFSPEPFMYVNLREETNTIDRFSLWLVSQGLYDVPLEEFKFILREECKHV